MNDEIKELKQQLARIKAAFAQALENLRRADDNRLQAILDWGQAERELAAHATKETKSDLKNAKKKVKQATEEFETADKAFVTVYKQK
ncbi:hypothetical protein CJI54_06660, partial [Bifidobacteriaceae bacterium NR026]